MDVVGWLIFLFALMFSVGLHEAGHFLTAKKFGMKVSRFFLGFGPTLWSTRLGETEYGVKALPLGGFVSILGMTSLEEVHPEDEPRTFRRQPAWQRLIVLGAGSFMHFLLAAVLLFGLALALGTQDYTTTQLGTISACVPANVQALDNNAACAPGAPKSAAALAGLRVGDTVTAFNGTPVSTYDQLTAAIKKATAGETVTITVRRDGQPVVVHATLGEVSGRSGGFLGIGQATVFQPVNPFTYVGSNFWQTIDGSGQALSQLPAAIPHLFAANRASTPAGDLTSTVGDANVTGQIVASSISWQSKVSFVLLIIASLNIFVGLFNLLPLLPLDGGHMAVVVWERVRAWFARRRRRPDPGLVDYTKLLPVSLSVFMIIVILGATLILADIVNPLKIG